jgi:hypothetical protein
MPSSDAVSALFMQPIMGGTPIMSRRINIFHCA